jgi:SAM-dependent methyltransferase
MTPSAAEEPFRSTDYWEKRYSSGRNSGKGSYGELAAFKAEYLNHFASAHDILDVVELGSGDGNQTGLFNFNNYVGIDVAETAIKACRERFASVPSLDFRHVNSIAQAPLVVSPADLTLSLDVLYHLVEDAIFEEYMDVLFALSRRFVIIYASNFDRAEKSQHVRHRYFIDHVSNRHERWRLVQVGVKPTAIRGQSPASFYVFEKKPRELTSSEHALESARIILQHDELGPPVLEAAKGRMELEDA